MADIINLWQVEHYRRRRNMDAKLSKAQEQAEEKQAAKWDELHRNRVSMRAWKPEDDGDDGPEVA